jgi:hypothetical protein
MAQADGVAAMAEPSSSAGDEEESRIEADAAWLVAKQRGIWALLQARRS